MIWDGVIPYSRIGNLTHSRLAEFCALFELRCAEANKKPKKEWRELFVAVRNTPEMKDEALETIALHIINVFLGQLDKLASEAK